jgi:hypothetical protein
MSGYTGNDGSALVGGLNPSSIVQAGIVDAQGRWILSPNAVANPFITEDQIRAYTIAGNAYSATTGKLTAPGAATLGFQLFAPANNTKNIMIYSLVLATANSGSHQIFKIAANVNSIAGWTDVAASITNNGASVATSTVTASYSNTNLTGGLLGTAREVAVLPTNSTLETPTNGECIWLPAGAGAISGMVVYFGIAGANVWGITCEYLEF